MEDRSAVSGGVGGGYIEAQIIVAVAEGKRGAVAGSVGGDSEGNGLGIILVTVKGLTGRGKN